MGHGRGHGGRGGHGNRGSNFSGRGHGDRRRDYEDDRSRDDDRDYRDQRDYDAPPRDAYRDAPAEPRYFKESRPRLRVSWVWVLAGLAIWTVGAWILYSVADPVLAWIAANAGVILDTGKAASSLAGGEAAAAAAVLKAVDVNTFVGQAIALIAAIAKPAIVLAWLVGAIAMLAAPVILPKVMQRLGGRH